MAIKIPAKMLFNIFKKLKSLTKTLVILVLLVAGLFVLFEGWLGFYYLFKEIRSAEKNNQKNIHVRYDEVLGWDNLPNARLKNVFGRGLHVATNSLGARHKYEFNPEVPPGKYRIICSGDSFTFGFGVSDGQTWVDFLEEQDQRLETVNLGQPGYGLDQMYLKYLKKNKQLDHHLHIFAFILEDIYRIPAARRKGYNKPVIKIKDDWLVVTNVPVPRTFSNFSWLNRNQGRLDRLNIFKLINNIKKQPPAEVLAGRINEAKTEDVSDEMLKDVSIKIFKTLEKMGRKEKVKQVFVLLPFIADRRYSKNRDNMRNNLKEAALKNKIVFIDLIENFRRLPEAEAIRLFRKEVDKHYSVAGHRWVAQEIFQELQKNKMFNWTF